jgi:hypothetical protein
LRTKALGSSTNFFFITTCYSWDVFVSQGFMCW